MSDSQRPLTDEGKDETKEVAQGLKRLNVKPDLFVSSPLVRAKQTAEIIARVLDYEEPLKISDSLCPGGSPGEFFKYFKQNKFERVNEMFVVGHEPDIGRLALALMWAGPEVEMPFKKAAVCRIDVADLPPSLPGVIKWFITPKIATSISK